MNHKTTGLMEKVRHMEEDLESELRDKRNEFQSSIKNGKVNFEKRIKEIHLTFKRSVPQYLRNIGWLMVFTSPIIYSLIIPLTILDAWTTFYQYICFPIYGIQKVKRSDYFLFDRHFLHYLNIVEKAGYIYCSYATGLAAYLREVIGRTEQHFCPIKHSKKILSPHQLYQKFYDYGDAKSYHHGFEKKRKRFGKEY